MFLLFIYSHTSVVYKWVKIYAEENIEAFMTQKVEFMFYLLVIIINNAECSNITRYDPKFSDKQAYANSADLDQTAPRGAV